MSNKGSDSGPDTKEAEDLAAALNHSAERVQTLWFSFLIFMVYLAVTTATTTHRMLLLEDGKLNLPVLNAALQVTRFYEAAPVIFVAFHFYMLMNLVLLARTAKRFDDSLERAFLYDVDNDAREDFRMRIENTLFVQLLVGAVRERKGANARLLGLMAYCTIAMAPVLLLLMIQTRFLPYHHVWISWFHRGLVVIDLVLVWALWPGYLSQYGERFWPKWRLRLVIGGLLSAAALGYSMVVDTFPGEYIYFMRQSLIGTRFQFEKRVFTFANTLQLEGKDLVDDDEKNEHNENCKVDKKNYDPNAEAFYQLRGRDLTQAALGGADIHRIDFAAAILNGANLTSACAVGSEFKSVDDNGVWRVAKLNGVLLDNANLRKANFQGAQLKMASLIKAKLQGSNLACADLRGANLYGAYLEGAHLEGANLNNANFTNADLTNAQLEGASMEGAIFKDAFLPNDFAWMGENVVGLEKVPQDTCQKKNEKKEESGPKESTAAHDMDYEMRLAEVWIKNGCDAEGAPYGIQAIVRWLDPEEAFPPIPKESSPFAKSSPKRANIAETFRAPTCNGAYGLSNADKAKLFKIACEPYRNRRSSGTQPYAPCNQP